MNYLKRKTSAGNGLSWLMKLVAVGAIATGTLVTGFASGRPAVLRFMTNFAYAGPTRTVHPEAEAQDGKPIYADRAYRIADLPVQLQGADYIQTSNSDKYFKSTDLFQITVKAGSIVSVAHDARLPRPDWLTNQFKAKDISVMVEGRPLTVFQRQAEQEEVVTLGPNVLVPDGRSCYMYLVFVSASTKQ